MPQMTIAEALRQAIREEMRRDPTVSVSGRTSASPVGSVERSLSHSVYRTNSATSASWTRRSQSWD